MRGGAHDGVQLGRREMKVRARRGTVLETERDGEGEERGGGSREDLAAEAGRTEGARGPPVRRFSRGRARKVAFPRAGTGGFMDA